MNAVKFGVSVVVSMVFYMVFYMGAAYVMNKYGLNVVDQPFDFILVLACLAIGNAIVDFK